VLRLPLVAEVGVPRFVGVVRRRYMVAVAVVDIAGTCCCIGYSLDFASG